MDKRDLESLDGVKDEIQYGNLGQGMRKLGFIAYRDSYGNRVHFVKSRALDELSPEEALALREKAEILVAQQGFRVAYAHVTTVDPRGAISSTRCVEIGVIARDITVFDLKSGEFEAMMVMDNFPAEKLPLHELN